MEAAVLSAGAEEAAAESAEPQAARLRASAAAVTAAIAEVRFMCVFSLFPKFMWYSLDVLPVLHRKQANCTAVLRRFRPQYGTIAVKVLQRVGRFCVERVKFVKFWERERVGVELGERS